MKKEYKIPSIEVVKIEQTLLQTGSPGQAHNEEGNHNQFAPGYGGGKGRGRYDEDDFDEEEED